MNQFEITTSGGHQVDTLNPDADTITIEDIATGLARLPRYCGHTPGPAAYSVAQHSVMLALQCMSKGYRREWCLWALVHDGHEALGLGDVATPTRQALLHLMHEHVHGATGQWVHFDPFKAWKERMDKAIAHSVGLEWDEVQQVLPDVKKADQALLEAEQQWRVEETGPVITIPLEGTPVRVRVWGSAEAREKFLQVYTALMPASQYHERGSNWVRDFFMMPRGEVRGA